MLKETFHFIIRRLVAYFITYTIKVHLKVGKDNLV